MGIPPPLFLCKGQERVTKLGRKAKCRICRSVLDTTTAFRVISHNKNNKSITAYYCSKEEYQNDCARKEKVARDYYAVENAITEIFGHKVENDTIHKEWKRWNNLASNEEIATYLTENKNYLLDVMKKDFSSEFGQIRYFSTILCSKLIDFKQRKKETEKPKVQVDETFYEAAPVTRNKRRSLADLEDEF